jgi:hypothetical protein
VAFLAGAGTIIFNRLAMAQRHPSGLVFLRVSIKWGLRIRGPASRERYGPGEKQYADYHKFYFM